MQLSSSRRRQWMMIDRSINILSQCYKALTVPILYCMILLCCETIYTRLQFFSTQKAQCPITLNYCVSLCMWTIYPPPTPENTKANKYITRNYSNCNISPLYHNIYFLIQFLFILNNFPLQSVYVKQSCCRLQYGTVLPHTLHTFPNTQTSTKITGSFIPAANNSTADICVLRYCIHIIYRTDQSIIGSTCLMAASAGIDHNNPFDHKKTNCNKKGCCKKEGLIWNGKT